MLTSLVLHLESPAAATLPASLGRAGQAALLRLVASHDMALAAALHEGDGPRPYTASNLVLGKRRGGTLAVTAGDRGWLRFTGLTEPVGRCLEAVAADPPRRLELDGFELAVAGATLGCGDTAGWAGQTRYQELAARCLLGPPDPPPHRVTLEFVSPTTFRSGGRYLPLPLPELVFGSLLDRWQAFAPVALSPEVRRFAAEAVAIGQCRLRTRSLPVKGGGLLVGFTGAVTFVALNRDRYWLRVLQLLAAFAFYSGVGYGTAAGLGQVRPAAARRE
jgi:CRISPR-associated endoribonuclease Cas6